MTTKGLPLLTCSALAVSSAFFLRAMPRIRDSPPPSFVPQACQIVLAAAAESHALGVPSMLEEGGAYQLWQAQHEFALTALRTSHNVSAGTIAAISKMILQAHDGWTRPHPDSKSVTLPCVPRKQLHNLLRGLVRNPSRALEPCLTHAVASL